MFLWHAHIYLYMHALCFGLLSLGDMKLIIYYLKLKLRIFPILIVWVSQILRSVCRVVILLTIKGDHSMASFYNFLDDMFCRIEFLLMGLLELYFSEVL